jgi:hypothetical protein
MKFSIMTLSVKGLFGTISINNTLENNTAIMLSVVMLSYADNIYCNAERHYAECVHPECRRAGYYPYPSVCERSCWCSCLPQSLTH